MKGLDLGSTNSDGLNEDAQDIIKDNLDVMYDIIMQIKEDEEFAKSIYADCPRLQHMLAKRPDLKPIFEDPKLVAINFEQVYRDSGGVLPGDEEEEIKPQKSYIVAIVNSPCFKVLKVFLFFKKIMACVLGGGMAMLMGCWKSLCCFDDPSDLEDEDAEEEDENPKNKENREALNKAAEHMEDPEVQEQMQDLLDNDPDALADAIEDDDELRALRDNNELCAELMTDPETMRILTDPENLRALGEAPDLIEADFNDPDWKPPIDDVEAGNGVETVELDLSEAEFQTESKSFQGADYASDDGMDFDFSNHQPDMENGHEIGFDGEGSIRLEEDLAAEGEAGEPEAEGEGGDEEEDGEFGEDFELGEAENDKGGNNANANAKGQQNKQENKQSDQRDGGFFAQVGAGLTDMLAAEFVGIGVSEVTGQDDGLAGLEEAEGAAADLEEAVEEAVDEAEGASDTADAGNNAANAASTAADVAVSSEMVLNEDMADEVEEGVDEIEETNDRDIDQEQAIAAGAAGAAGAGLVAGDMATSGIEESDEDKKGEVKEKKSRFGMVGNWASAISTAGKEYLAGALLGDDLGEMFVERIEDDEEEENKDDKTDEDPDVGYDECSLEDNEFSGSVSQII